MKVQRLVFTSFTCHTALQAFPDNFDTAVLLHLLYYSDSYHHTHRTTSTVLHCRTVQYTHCTQPTLPLPRIYRTSKGALKPWDEAEPFSTIAHG